MGLSDKDLANAGNSVRESLDLQTALDSAIVGDHVRAPAGGVFHGDTLHCRDACESRFEPNSNKVLGGVLSSCRVPDSVYRSALVWEGGVMRGIAGLDPGWGITIVRITVSIILMVHGYQKWFQFGVTTGVTGLFAKFGLPVPALFAFVAATLELGGGILLFIGLFARWVGLLVAAEFSVAAFYVQFRLRGYLAGELEMMMLAGGLLLFLAGPGRAAVDEAWLEKR